MVYLISAGVVLIFVIVAVAAMHLKSKVTELNNGFLCCNLSIAIGDFANHAGRTEEATTRNVEALHRGHG